MRVRTRFLAAAVMTAVAAFSVAAAQHVLADFTGKWTITVSLPDRTSQSAIDWTQKGDSLSGTIAVEGMGNRAISGVVKADTVDFDFSIDIEGQQLWISGYGVLRDKDTVEGQLSLANDMGSFPFTAKRQP